MVVELQGELTLLEVVKLGVVTMVVFWVLAVTALESSSQVAVAVEGVGVTMVEGLFWRTGARAAVLSRAAPSQQSLTRRAHAQAMVF